MNAALETNVLAAMTGSGELNAFMLFFQSRLADAVSLSSDPEAPGRRVSGELGNSGVAGSANRRVSWREKVRVGFFWRERGAHRWDVCRAADTPA